MLKIISYKKNKKFFRIIFYVRHDKQQYINLSKMGEGKLDIFSCRLKSTFFSKSKLFILSSLYKIRINFSFDLQARYYHRNKDTLTYLQTYLLSFILIKKTRNYSVAHLLFASVHKMECCKGTYKNIQQKYRGCDLVNTALV